MYMSCYNVDDVFFISQMWPINTILYYDLFLKTDHSVYPCAAPCNFSLNDSLSEQLGTDMSLAATLLLMSYDTIVAYVLFMVELSFKLPKPQRCYLGTLSKGAQLSVLDL